MSSSSAIKRVFGYDLLKALAMFMVVFYHLQMLDFSFTPDVYYIPNFNKIIQLICAAGVPLFFMVNGALMIDKKMTLNKVVYKASKLFMIAIFWTLVLRCGVLGLILGNGLPKSITDFLSKYWFLYSLAFVYIFNYLIQVLPKWLSLLLVTAIFIATFLNNFVWDIILFIHPDHTLPSWGHIGLFTLYGVVYSRIGAYLKHTKLSYFICILLFFLGLALNIFTTIAMTNHDGALYDGVNGSFPTFGALLMSTGIFCILQDVKDLFGASQLIKTVGINSGGVYIFHVFFVSTISDQMISIFHQQTFSFFIVLLLALSITLLCAYISEWISRTPGKVLLKL